MTWMLRKIDDVAPWLTLAEQDDLTETIANPPLWAIRLFTPSIKDRGSLSFYEVPDEPAAKPIAAAFGFQFGDIGKAATPISFMAVERYKLEAAGFAIEENAGGLHHESDNLHRGITPRDLEDVVRLAGLFIGGELFPVEGRAVQSTGKDEARCGRFKFVPIAKLGHEHRAVRNVIKLVGEELVIVRGVAA